MTNQWALEARKINGILGCIWKSCQQAKSWHCSALCSTPHWKDTRRAVCPVLGSPVWERREHTGESPVKGHERPSGAPLIGRTESASRASLEKPCRDQISVCKIQRKGVLEREQAYAVVPSDRTRYNGHKHRRFLMNIMKILLLCGWPSTGTGCLERLRSLHSWRYSKAIWIQSWAISSRWPCLSSGEDTMTSWSAFQPQPLADLVIHITDVGWGSRKTKASWVNVTFSNCLYQSSNGNAL